MDAKDNTYKFQLFYAIKESDDINNPLLILNFDNIINHYQLLNYNYNITIEPTLNNNNIKLNDNLKQTFKDKLYINKNTNNNTITFSNITELTKMIKNITLKYKNINKKEILYESEDVDKKI